jgi:molybdopterin/thiamine biosynthesis adenylyltransferase
MVYEDLHLVLPARIAKEPQDLLSLPFRLVDGGTVAILDPAGEPLRRVVSARLPASDQALLAEASLAIDGDTASLALGDDRPPVLFQVTLVPWGVELFDRNAGVFESDALAGKRVVIVGLGSGGSAVLRELVRAGVGWFLLVDFDRLTPGNVCRHELSLRDVGRLKVDALADYVTERNPTATVETLPERLGPETARPFVELIAEVAPDVIICGTDNRESRLIVNRAAVETDTYCLFGAVRRRAYAGEVLQLLPGVTPCYQCFVMRLPMEWQAPTGVEADDGAHTTLPAYADRPVPAEPGLSMDIAPVSLMLAKLALVRMLKDAGSDRFDALAEDLAAPRLIWIGRREPGTIYEQWPPLADSIGDGPRVQQWLGLWLDRDPECPACGLESPSVPEEDLDFFR